MKIIVSFFLTMSFVTLHGQEIYWFADCEPDVLAKSYLYDMITMTCTGPITRSKTKKDFTNSYINVFPNPTNGQLHINADRPIHHLAIYSMTGQLLSEISNAADNTILDLSAYKYQGFVTLKAIDFEGRISTHKVILIND